MSFISGSHRMYTSKSQLKGVVSGWKKGKKVFLMKATTTRTTKNNYRAEFLASHNKNLCQLYCETRNNTCLIRFINSLSKILKIIKLNVTL